MLTIIVTACKKNTPVQAPVAQQLELKPLEYTYLSAKAKMNYSGGGDETKAIADIRMRKDSVIWVSIRTSTGIEGIRALLRPDSAFVVNRLEKSYYAFDYKGLSEKLNFPLTFTMLQSVLTGEMPFQPEGGNTKMSQSDSIIHLSTRNGSFQVDSDISMAFNKLKKITFADLESPNSLSLVYDKFLVADNKVMPFLFDGSLIYIKDGKRYGNNVTLDFSKIEFPSAPITFSFSIPESYEKR